MTTPLYATDIDRDDSDLWQALGQTAMTMSRDAMLVIDDRGTIIFTNQAAGEGIGVRSGASISSEVPELWTLVNEMRADGRRRDRLAVAIGGSDYLTTIHPVNRGRRIAAAVIKLEKRDDAIAGRMQFLQEMTRERDAIIDSSSDGLFVCDSDATVIRVNPASERIHKIKAPSVIGKNMVDLIREGFIDRSAALEAIRKKSTVSLLQNKDNRKLISTGTPVFNNEGQLIRVVVSERDITEIDTLQRCLEEEQALKDQLQNQLAEIQRSMLQTQKIIARSPGMVQTLHQALKVSKADSSVLITGESGVGKGLFANLIHKNSGRADKPLIRINCGAIPEPLIESELFGYEKGAFTGAQAGGKPGLLELAHGGTLFLDEIAELPPASQVKLLRFLEDGRITRLGGTQTRRVDARILAATHRDLKQMVDEGTFRQDLYYRMNVIPLFVPPLRDRKECLLPLLRHYIDYFARKIEKPKRLSRLAIDSLSSYGFPGNVRELMNICERAVVMSEMEVIDLRDLPKDVSADVVTGDPSVQWPPQMSLEQILQSVERTLLMDRLRKHRNQLQIARALGISQPTVARRLKKYGLLPSPMVPDR